MLNEFFSYQRRTKIYQFIIFILSTISVVIVLNFLFTLSEVIAEDDVGVLTFVDLLIAIYISGALIGKYSNHRITKWIVKNFNPKSQQYREIIEFIFFTDDLNIDSIKENLDIDTDIKAFLIEYPQSIISQDKALYVSAFLTFHSKKPILMFKGLWNFYFLLIGIPLLIAITYFIIVELKQLLNSPEGGWLLGIVFFFYALLIVIYRGWDSISRLFSKYSDVCIDSDGIKYQNRFVSWNKIVIDDSFKQETEKTFIIENEKEKQKQHNLKSFEWKFEVINEAHLYMNFPITSVDEVYQIIYFYSKIYKMQNELECPHKSRH